MGKSVNIIGAGLAGVEAAWKLAEAGIDVNLYEMKPKRFSPAHKNEDFAELVCSNSLRSNDSDNAAGLLKEEMRFLGSFFMSAADQHAVPAGKALAVDRKRFARYITEVISKNPKINVFRREIEKISELHDGGNLCVVATGPLTTDTLSKDIALITGDEHLYFYDSVAPILDANSIDFSQGFKASRYGYGGDDYWNFPLDEAQYTEFLMDLAGAEKVEMHSFEKPQYFEGCLPIEVMASRGPGTLRYGPMKPFGLSDPKTGEEPHALIQLRQEDIERSMYNMVGFQTRMTWHEQKRIFRKIPGLAKAEFLRYGVIHRNTYINSPKLLTNNLEMEKMSGLFFGGQITGVEGYIESAATGLWLGIYLKSLIMGEPIEPPPSTTALGSLLWHVANPNHRNFQPMNVNFGLMPIIKEKIPKKLRKSVMAERAKKEFKSWLIRAKVHDS